MSKTQQALYPLSQYLPHNPYLYTQLYGFDLSIHLPTYPASFPISLLRVRCCIRSGGGCFYKAENVKSGKKCKTGQR